MNCASIDAKSRPRSRWPGKAMACSMGTANGSRREDSRKVKDIRSTRLLPHQLHALEAVERAVEAGMRNMRLVMAIGSGASAVIGHVFARMLKSGQARRPLYLTPINILAVQMAERLRGLDLGEDGLLGEVATINLLQSDAEPDNSDGTVTIATPARLRSLVRTHPGVDFDLIVLNEVEATSNSPSTVRDSLIDRFDATVIVLNSRVTLPEDPLAPPVYVYDLRAALADGVLIEPVRQASASSTGAWPTFDPQDPAHDRRQIFLGSVDEDDDSVQRLVAQLRTARVRVADIVHVTPSDVAPGDVFVPVLSPNSVQMPFLEDDVSRSLERRGVDIVPAFIEYCAIPAHLAGRLPVDVTAGADGLLRRLQASIMIDLDSLGPARFDRLTTDLLARLCFVLKPLTAAHVGDSGVDFTGTFQDPDGFGIATEYLIQAKLTRSAFRDVDKLVHLVQDAGQPWRGMVITSGHLTSVTMRRLARAKDEGVEVQVIDGPRLRSLLLRYPDLIADHFLRG